MSRAPVKRRKQPIAAPAARAVPNKILPWTERHSLLIAVVLVVAASIRIVATYHVFNHTSDEPAHIACGMEWLDKGVYQWEPQHPPLARVAAAVGPYLSGRRSQNTPKTQLFAMSKEGAAILYDGHRYDRTLALARLGILPFFWVACAVVYWWGVRYFGRAVAVAAVFLFSFLPTILGHAALATTDMALTATMGAAFVAGAVWLKQPTILKAVWFGVWSGLMVLSKFSALAFFPASVALALAWYFYCERTGAGLIWAAARVRLPSFCLAVAAGMVIVWAGYRFSFGDSGLGHLRLPAPELFAGIRQVKGHNAAGHPSYFLGARSDQGFLFFFPVALAVKTPLAFLILLAALAAPALRKQFRGESIGIPLAFSAAILAVGMSSKINIGVRHILPVYIGLTMVSAVALVRLVNLSEARKWLKVAVAVLLVWFSASSLWSHPDYLPYFNELAGGEPEKILADSDLDWGQDLKRLSTRLHEAGATDVIFDKYIIGDWEKEHGFPRIHMMKKDTPSYGWNAIGVGLWKESRLVIWPDSIKPHERVGKSILLWYFPPPQ